MSVSGKLRRNAIERWEIVNDDAGVELTSGSVVELKIDGHWIKTRIEHDGSDYYATTCGVMLTDGLPARME